MFKFFSLVVVALTIVAVAYSDVSITNEQIGLIFIGGILLIFLVFLLFKFCAHYKIQAISKFTMAFYYSVFEYKKRAQKSLKATSFVSSVRDQAETAISANFDPEVAKVALKVPISMYTKDNSYMSVLRARIHEADRLKNEAKELQGQASKIIKQTEDILVEKKLKEKEQSGTFFDSLFGIHEGVQNMIDLTASELQGHDYNESPDYEIIAHIAMDNNPYLSSVLKVFSMEGVTAVLNRAPFMVILIGIIGTFAGFYLALSEGGDIKAGAAVAIVSSLVALPVSLGIDYINTLYPDREKYQSAFERFQLGLEILFNFERDRYPNRKGRRNTDPVTSPSQFEDYEDED